MNNPNTAKHDARAFERWINEASPSWPDDLKKLGTFALLALKTLDVPKPPELMVREAAKDMAAFLEAYAAHIASKGAAQD